MWVIGCLALVGIALAIYGALFNFTDSRGSSAEAQRQHNRKGMWWWIWFLVGLPVCVAILTAMGG